MGSAMRRPSSEMMPRLQVPGSSAASVGSGCQIRNPKPETRKESEARSPKPLLPLSLSERMDPERPRSQSSPPEGTVSQGWDWASSDHGFRISFGFRPSDFGFLLPRVHPLRASRNRPPEPAPLPLAPVPVMRKVFQPVLAVALGLAPGLGITCLVLPKPCRFGSRV